jgi:anhydro-N-acetylmuramic acid kinase
VSVYVGLMSGTSLDGISAAVVRFESGTGVAGRLEFELLAFVSTEYTSQQRDRIHAALTQGTAREYCRLAFDLGTWLADATVAVLAEAGVPKSTVRAIG